MTTPAASRFETAALSHPGMVRAANEDAYLSNAETGIWAIADGMGGHDRGDLASRTLTEALRLIGPQTSAAQLLARCEACVAEVNDTLLRLAAERRLVIGTTLVLLLNYDVHYACIWSGDSRVYRVRQGQITMLSRDHTEVQELVEQGVLTIEESRSSPRRNVVTRAIGVTARAELELNQGVLVDGDVFVLCSDGLTNYVSDEELCAGVASAPSEVACQAFVDLALHRGGSDNVTVIVVRYRDPGEAAARIGRGRDTVIESLDL